MTGDLSSTTAALTAAVVLALLTLAAGTLEARAEEIPDLPGGTHPSAGFPPYVPQELHDRARVEAWCEAAGQAGRARAGTILGGDLLLSAAWALDRRVGRGTGALDLYREAARAYPTRAAASGRVAALLEVARLQGIAGRIEAQRVAFDQAKHLGLQGPPVDAGPAESARWNRLANHLALALPRLEASLLEDEGRLAAAADVLEAYADAHERDLDTSSAWARAARLRARSGDETRALEDVDRALALSTSDLFAADWSFWRLHLRHGRLDAEGAVPIQTSWPGEEFTRDVHTCLHGLRGNPHVGEWLLTVGSTALASGENEIALDLYLIALADAAFVDSARNHPLVWRGLLAAFPVALRLARFEDADRILAAVSRIGVVPVEEMDGYRVALATARAAAEEAGEAPERPPPDDPVETPPPEAAPVPGRGRLLLPPDEEPNRAAAHGGPVDDAVPPAWPAPVLGGAVFLLLLFVVARRWRRD